ncbi:MAG: Tol-Pal system beta propeller repeat protein TolB [Burkholderiaceae bacterium]
MAEYDRQGSVGQPPVAGIGRRQLLGGTVSGASLFLAAPAAFAQFKVEVAGVGLTQRPFALAPFKRVTQAPVAVDQVVIADLERSGEFRQVASASGELDENTRPNFEPWRAVGADALITGSINQVAVGRWDVRYRLWEVVRGEDLGGVSFPAQDSELRLAAHRVADSVYEKLTGVRGVFATRVAYVTADGSQNRLWIADADGESPQAALDSPQPVISPAWSPEGERLAYVSFEARKPVVYVHTLATGKRQVVANYRGSNSAPAWMPDGKGLVATLSLAGHSQIYAIGLEGGRPTRLSDSQSIDTEPTFSPDGKLLYFVSDRGGSPQIYRMAAGGGNVQRITFSGGYNVSPSIAPDGNRMAYVGLVEGRYTLMVMDLTSGAAQPVPGALDVESPSFSANGRMIVYASRTKGRDELITTTVDGRVRTRLLGAKGDIREPAWGPFRD